ncbi:MAG: ABC transporter substrate-binding protein [Candidatus Dormibacteraeota bacterium]|uniref:ABC transporter substrate-binding protein n=2 Tax=Candidatus Aeolococcus gillhamiae TaxID=3127015 RepID=A0A2W5ZF52_9BACT|nr:ABC transporter substrate-binding protein [Candidatus Dormibacteraeota bacterium]PZR84090.1 MAG: ABC transporter substrate-binding protein [Candidatus Dormibacter sp. RRmetagenome_bin12]
MTAACTGIAAVLVAACGSSNSGTGSTSNQASAPGITPTSVTIGSTQPLTGPAAPGYSEIAPAADAYFKYVNAHGGVFGRSINFKFLDDGYNPTNTASLTRRLVLQDQVYAMFDALGTPTHLAVVDYLNQQKVPDLFVASGCNCWNNVSAHPYTFGWQPDYTIEGKILGDYVKRTYSGQKVGYFAQGPNDEFGDDGVRGLNDVLQNTNVTVVNPVQYYAPTTAGAQGVKAEMAAMQAAGVQVVVSFSIPLFTAAALASAASIGYHPAFVVSNVGADVPTLTSILTGGALGVTLPAALLTGMTSDTYLPLLGDSSNPWVTLFKSIKSQYAPNLPWDGNVLYGLSSAYTFVEALRAAGQNPTRDNLRHAVENSHFTGPGLAPLGFSSTNHLGYTGVQVVTLTGGNVQTLVGPLFTTDDSAGGAVTQSGASPSTPPPNGIPSD